jgi:uncharacterized protein YjiS (DUF1127 family)
METKMTYAIAGRAGAAPHSSRRAAGHSFIETIRHRRAVHRTIRELDRLTDRQLADIGLTRGEITAAAQRVAAEVTGIPAGAAIGNRSVLAEIGERFYRARARASMVRDLRRLPDHVLADIGIERGAIEEMVEAVLDRRDREGPAAEQPPRAGSPVHDLLHGLEAAVRPLLHWNMSRIAAGQFARLDGETLSDLGYVKGDVDWVPDEMASRRLKAPANRNQARAGVA